MAKLVLSTGLKKIQGRIAGFVYRFRNGEQTISKAPDMSKVKWSEAQVAHRERFQEAVAHAKAVMRDPRLKAVYEAEAAKRGKRPFDLAVSDYFREKRGE